MDRTNTNFINSWDNRVRAESYAKLELRNTYHLAYRDLPDIITKHVAGTVALDFGCGTGRSTRFLKQQGYNVVGIDISTDMLSIAQSADPGGDYQLVENGRYNHLGKEKFDLVTAIFTFDNIPGWENRTRILSSLGELMKPSGRMVTLHSAPELYVNEWASFTTKDFPQNKKVATGDVVQIIMTDVEDRRPVEDIYWSLEDYYKLFEKGGMEVEALYKPLGRTDEPFIWVTETTIAPWLIFVLKRKA